MALTVSDIAHDADLFRRAYPHWPHPEPERSTGMTIRTGGDRRPGEGHDHSWAEDVAAAEACCPDFNPGLTGRGIRCPGDPEPEPETEAAADLSKPLARLDERVTHFGLAWMTSGPRGRQWAIGWQQAKGEVKGWDYKTGRTGFLGTASGVEEARAEALRIAAMIAAGKTRG